MRVLASIVRVTTFTLEPHERSTIMDKLSIEDTLPMTEDAYEARFEAWDSGDLDDLPEAPEPKVAPCFGCDRLVAVSQSFCSDACNDEFHGYLVQA